MSCFENILPKNIISGMSGIVAFVFASQIFIKQHDQFEDAADSCMQFSHWFSGSKPKIEELDNNREGSPFLTPPRKPN